jgi:hypothetical protein
MGLEAYQDAYGFDQGKVYWYSYAKWTRECKKLDGKLNYMTNVKKSDIVEWIKNAVETQMVKEREIPNAKVYLSCDRPHPDVILETKNADGDLQIVRFLII